MRRGRRGKSPVTLPGTTPRQKDAHAASPDGRGGQASVTNAPLLRRPPRATSCRPARRLRRRSDGGRPKTGKRKWTMRRQRVNSPRKKRPSTSPPPSPPRAPPHPPPVLGLPRLRRSGRVFLPDEQALGTLADDIDRPSSRLSRARSPRKAGLPPRTAPGQKNGLRAGKKDGRE